MTTAVGPDDNADGEPEDECDALAVSGLRQLRSVAVPGTGGEGRNSADTVGRLWVARTAESVPGRTTIPILDSVAAAVRYPAWAVVGVGSETEQEPGAGSWLMPEVIRMAH